ncbi:MAG: hypothetical protein ACLGI2_06995 [Acidimicrobiia bacterium]|jgi:hypothetical protein
MAASEHLADRLRRLRAREHLTREGLSVRTAELDPQRPVSVAMIALMESRSKPYRLPTRMSTRGLAIVAVARALNVPLQELLECFSPDELRRSCFSHLGTSDPSPPKAGSLAAFVDLLPTSADDLLRVPGVAHLKNQEAFAYLFALEREYAGLEMLVGDEPPFLFVDDEDLDRWIAGMGLDEADSATFRSLFGEYQAHFRDLALRGRKRYQVALNKQTFAAFLSRKSPSRAVELVDSMIAMLYEAPLFQMLLVDYPRRPDELEIISRHNSIPTDFADTLSVVIRQTSRHSTTVEYSLIPMPQTYMSLQRDIAEASRCWSIGLDQYESRHHEAGSREWSGASNDTTAQLLKEVLTTVF